MTAQQIAFKIVLEDSGSRFAVTVQPRQIDKPSRSFREHAEALAFAEDLSRVQGWPIADRSK